MKIDNGRRAFLIIPGVFEGQAGLQGNSLTFRPNRTGGSPRHVKGGLLDDKPIRLLSTTKDEVGPFWTSRFEVIS